MNILIPDGYYSFEEQKMIEQIDPEASKVSLSFSIESGNYEAEAITHDDVTHIGRGATRIAALFNLYRSVRIPRFIGSQRK